MNTAQSIAEAVNKKSPDYLTDINDLHYLIGNLLHLVDAAYDAISDTYPVENRSPLDRAAALTCVARDELRRMDAVLLGGGYRLESDKTGGAA